jgi:hypothetical protein
VLTCTAEADHWGGVIVTWFWLNIPLALLFFCCWAGIPLWHTCRRWNADLNAKHAEVAAKAIPVLLPAQSNPPAAEETSRPVHIGAADVLSR